MSTFWLSRSEVRDIDRRTIEEFGLPGVALMENAGRGCAKLLMRLKPDKQPVVVLCGPGNNGGDGFVIARHLDIRRWPVKVLLFGDPDRLTGDAAANYKVARRSGLRIELIPRQIDGERHPAVNDPGWWEGGGWVVDALYGTGLDRPLDAPFPHLFKLLRTVGRPIFAVDIPSGLDADTGAPIGAAIRATHTGTFVAFKKGFLSPPSQAWTGEVHVVDIGAPRVLLDEYKMRRAAE